MVTGPGTFTPYQRYAPRAATPDPARRSVEVRSRKSPVAAKTLAAWLKRLRERERRRLKNG